MIDQNRDGFIDVEDLKEIYASLGKSLEGFLNLVKCWNLFLYSFCFGI